MLPFLIEVNAVTSPVLPYDTIESLNPGIK